MVMVARYGERHSISPEMGGYPPLVEVGEGIFGASHGYYKRPGDGNMFVCMLVCGEKGEGRIGGATVIRIPQLVRVTP